MKNRNFKIGIYLLIGFLGILSCEEDEGPLIPFEERDRAEQQLADKDSLINYMSTHYYNSAFLSSGTNHRYADIIITELPKDDEGNYLPLPNPSENTLLIDDVETYTLDFADVEYEYYILRLNQGSGDSPNFTDAIRIRYEGYLPDTDDEDIFDSTPTPVNLDLIGVGQGTGAILGWQRIIPEFNSALDFTTGVDGIVNYNDYGLGVMFIPSGLAYYSATRSSIPAYSNLVFKFELLQIEENDHDFDLVPSYMEDLDGDLDLFNDDTDGNGIPNYIDFDDDGDGVPTRNEDIDGDGDPTNDIGINGIPKYLDPEETESNEVDE